MLPNWNLLNLVVLDSLNLENYLSEIRPMWALKLVQTIAHDSATNEKITVKSCTYI